MDVVVLTKVGGILGPFAWIFGLIMNAIYEVLDLVGIPNVGLTIILFTLIANLLMLPLTIKQQRYSRVSSLVTPEIQKINKKYKGKTDEVSQRRMQAETMEVYKKYGASPSSGCLPLLISFPILLALYRIIYNIPSYVNSIHDLFLTIATPIQQTTGGAAIMDQLIEELRISVSSFDFNNVEKIIDALNGVKTTGWDTVANAFASNPDVVQAIDKVKDTIININSMPGGLNVMDAPVHFSQGVAGIFPGILIPILAGLTQWLSSKMMQTDNGSKNSDDTMGSTMKTMNIMMPLMSVFFCFTFSAGIGVYWIASSVVMILIQMIVNKYMERIDINQMVEKNIEKANVKRVKKGQKPLKAKAVMNVRTIEEERELEEKKEAELKERVTKQVEKSTEYYSTTQKKKGKLASKAGMVQQYNEKSEKKNRK